MTATHEHYFTWDKNRRLFVCRCGVSVTDREIMQRYGQCGNLDVDPKEGAKRIARRKDAHKKRTG